MSAGELRVPEPGSRWYPDVSEFALTYNAYDRHGGFDPVASKAKAILAAWLRGLDLPQDLDALRSALFFEQRRWRQFDQEPSGRDREYIDALLQAIRGLAGSSIPGPADPLP